MPDTSFLIIFNVFSQLLFTVVLETMICCLYLGLLLLNGTLLVQQPTASRLATHLRFQQIGGGQKLSRQDDQSQILIHRGCA